MANLPYEVWLQVVEHLPDGLPRELLGVNHILFEIAMDDRYRDVKIIHSDKKTLWTLFRLREPTIALRVRHLKVNPFFVRDEFMSAWNARQAQTGRRRIAWKVKTAFDRVLHLPMHSWLGKKLKLNSSGRERQVRPEDVISAMIEGFSALSNLSELELTDRFSVHNPDHEMRPQYARALAVFNPKLHKLSLRMELESLPELLGHLPHFSVLGDLDITFPYSAASRISESHDSLLKNTVTPFINRHGSTITKLALTSRSSLDLSAFFYSLTPFPILEEVVLDATFENTFASDHSAFTHFLQRHTPTLQNVTIRVFQLLSHSPGPPLEQSFSSWLKRNASETDILCGLKSLTISTFDSTDFQPLVHHIRHSADTLTALAVGGRFLSPIEVDTLISVFSHRSRSTGLRSLRLNVMIFSPELICLLAEKLCGLQNLSIYCTDYTPNTVDMFEVQIRTHTALLSNWPLCDIGVWHSRESAIMHRIAPSHLFMIASCIPSIYSFWGHGYKLKETAFCRYPVHP